MVSISCLDIATLVLNTVTEQSGLKVDESKLAGFKLACTFFDAMTISSNNPQFSVDVDPTTNEIHAEFSSDEYVAPVRLVYPSIWQ